MASRRFSMHRWAGNSIGKFSSTCNSSGLRLKDVLGKETSFNSEAVEAYTRLTGDSNPIHCSPGAAREAGFRACVVPGMLCASLFPAIIGSRFANSIYVSQDLRFKSPLLVGESVLAEVEVCDIVKLRRHAKVTFLTRCLRIEEEGILKGNSRFLEGEAVALLPVSYLLP